MDFRIIDVLPLLSTRCNFPAVAHSARRTGFNDAMWPDIICFSKAGPSGISPGGDKKTKNVSEWIYFVILPNAQAVDRILIGRKMGIFNEIVQKN